MVRQRSDTCAPGPSIAAQFPALANYLEYQVGPQANALDADTHLLAEAFHGLGQLGLLAVKAPLDLGGFDCDSLDYSRFQALIGRYSGALAFLQTQHQSAAGFLRSGTNAALPWSQLSIQASLQPKHQ
ncbi:acyl-CoA dehydrogenase family protein [Romeria aff. gracilis LEGE 07310]|uniref:Acyl-CoA dehydrogenase family protein n=1 Tax=Vasconcelosia minhoensis LEGE 07310 TaxID=915328 RepID=A0A8J7AWY2_9CYAN|nr:acyl-CoA dehydrogenase family protein [Romeria gracilis]MBE9078873.1 acyl-CoA dehydrogenase family protein [Romeria aff. gracilis LEGE 07310]